MEIGDPMYRLVDNPHKGQAPVTQTLRVIHLTPKGVWVCWNYQYLSGEWPDKRFVLLGDGRRYAYPTFEAALDSYRHRKKRQIVHARAAIRNATDALAWCDRAIVGVDGITYEEPEPCIPLTPLS